MLSATCASELTQRLIEQLLQIAENNIPTRTVNIKKFTRLWLTERSEDAVSRKHAAQGTDHEAAAARACSYMVVKEHHEYNENMRERSAKHSFIA